MLIQNSDLHKYSLEITLKKMEELEIHMSDECSEILLHAFHQKPQLALQKLDTYKPATNFHQFQKIKLDYHHLNPA